MAPALHHSFECHPGRTVDVWLYRGVANAQALAAKAKDGSLTPEVALINARLVPDAFCALVAANRAVGAHQRGKLATRSLHAELVYALAASKHIRESLRRFGVPEGCSECDVLMARFDATDEERAAVEGMVQGEAIGSLDSLAQSLDDAAVKKLYKIQPKELEAGSLADAVTCRIGARDSL